MASSRIAPRLYLQFVLVMGVGEVAAQDVVNMPDVTKRPTAQSYSLELTQLSMAMCFRMKYGKSVLPSINSGKQNPTQDFPRPKKQRSV